MARVLKQLKDMKCVTGSIARTLAVFLTFDAVIILVLRVLGITPILSLHFSVILNLLVLQYGDRFVLWITGAEEVKSPGNRAVFALVKELAQKAKVPSPNLAIVNNPSPNAFTLGKNRRQATIFLHSGVFQALDDAQLTGVLSHEIAHVKSWDMLNNTTAAALASAVFYPGSVGFKIIERTPIWKTLKRTIQRIKIIERTPIWKTLKRTIQVILLIIFASLPALLIRVAIPKDGEFIADMEATKISGKQKALAIALKRIGNRVKNNPVKGNPATSHLYIINPFGGDKWGKVFSRHPSIEERIERLESLKT